MPTQQLGTPLSISTQVSADSKNIQVSWQEGANLNTTTYAVSFLAKDSLAPFMPDASTLGAMTRGPAAGACTMHVTPSEGSIPSASDLASKYIAQVIATGATPDISSVPGLQVYWTSSLSVIVQVGSKSFTLSKPSIGGVYRLPVSRTDPLTITLDDVKVFAESVGVGAANVPETWPNGSPIAGALNLYKLAIDTELKLFALDIAFTMDFSPIPGLTVKEVGLSVLRTDGAHSL